MIHRYSSRLGIGTTFLVFYTQWQVRIRRIELQLEKADHAWQVGTPKELVLLLLASAASDILVESCAIIRVLRLRLYGKKE